MLKNLLFLAGFSLFVVASYIGVNIFLELSSSTIPPTVQKNREPIEGSFDTRILDQLKTRSTIPVDLSTQTEIVADIDEEATAGARITITPSPTRLQ